MLVRRRRECLVKLGHFHSKPATEPGLLNGEYCRDAGKLLRSGISGEASLSRAVRRSSPILPQACASAGVTFPSRTRVDTAFRELNKKWGFNW